MWAKNKQSGFTIVELLIVIVVIAILAAISIVAFNGIQERARDSQRKNDLAAIAKALHLYNTDNGNFVGDGTCAQSGGWIMSDYDNTGPLLSIGQCLVNGKYLPSVINDPLAAKGCSGTECFYYMKYECGGNTYLYANLESMPHSTTDTDNACMTTLDSAYGMNYVLKIN